MANVSIKFNGKEYLLSCDDGQEESLKKLTSILDKKYSELKKSLGSIGESKLLLITAIKLIDEHSDFKQRVSEQKEKLDKLSNKFKELKSLAINYKDEKESDIRKLTNEINEFKDKIEKNKDLYEKTLDKTTKSIEKFIDKAEINQKKI